MSEMNTKCGTKTMDVAYPDGKCVDSSDGKSARYTCSKGIFSDSIAYQSYSQAGCAGTVTLQNYDSATCYDATLYMKTFTCGGSTTTMIWLFVIISMVLTLL
jgi:hypothetical protein